MARPLPVGTWAQRRAAGITGRGPWWERRALEGNDAYAEWERIANPAIYSVTAGFVGKAYEIGGEAEVSRRVLTVVRTWKSLSRQYAGARVGAIAPAVPVPAVPAV
jgi:hypothetical protein